MIRYASQGKFLPRNTLYAGNHANINLLFIKNWSLFDMQLNVAIYRHISRLTFAFITNVTQRFIERDTVEIFCRERLRQRILAGKHHAAHHIGLKSHPLLVSKEGYRQRSSGADTGILEGGNHLKAGHNAVVAIV